MSRLRSLAAKFIVHLPIALAAIASPMARASETHKLSSDEVTLFQKISSNSEQERPEMEFDPILCMVARARAKDMMRRHYFSHVTPGGKGPNTLVRREGYVLPSHYDRSLSGNNIESICMTTGTPAEVFKLWLKSPAHRTHVLAEQGFYRAQTSIGVGVARSPEEPHYKYYVFLSAPPNVSVNPPLVTLVSNKGVVLARTKPLASSLAALAAAPGL